LNGLTHDVGVAGALAARHLESERGEAFGKAFEHFVLMEQRALSTFVEQYRPRSAIVVCNEKRERTHGAIRVMPLRKFLAELWAGEIIA
jgi:hypothetical protein